MRKNKRLTRKHEAGVHFIPGTLRSTVSLKCEITGLFPKPSAPPREALFLPSICG